MNKTVGAPDRVLRGVLAAGGVAGAWALGFTTGWGIVLLVVAAIMALTGATGYCPLYSLLNIGTVPRDKAAAVRPSRLHVHRAA